MAILGQGGHFVDFSFFALNISETSNKHFDKFLVTFEVGKRSKPKFSWASIFFARYNSMAFAKVPCKDWSLTRKLFFLEIPSPNFRRLYLNEYRADFSITLPDWRHILSISKSVIKGCVPKKKIILFLFRTNWYVKEKKSRLVGWNTSKSRPDSEKRT